MGSYGLQNDCEKAYLKIEGIEKEKTDNFIQIRSTVESCILLCDESLDSVPLTSISLSECDDSGG